jgi:hypothetical protein
MYGKFEVPKRSSRDSRQASWHSATRRDLLSAKLPRPRQTAEARDLLGIGVDSAGGRLMRGEDGRSVTSEAWHVLARKSAA